MDNNILLKEKYSEFQRNYCHMLRHLKKNDGLYGESDIFQISHYMDTRSDQQLYDLASCLMSMYMYTPHSLRMHIYVFAS